MWNRKLGRTADHRKAMFRNMVTSLIEAGQIETTEMKAKELSSIMDELVTLAKRGDLHARRQAAAYVRNVIVDENSGQTALPLPQRAPRRLRAGLYALLPYQRPYQKTAPLPRSGRK